MRVLRLAFFLIGVISALTGVGGGVFFVPILLALGYSPEVAVGTSSIAVAITTSIGALGYYKHGLYDARITLKAILVAYPGVILGVYLTLSVPSVVRPMISLMLLFSALKAFKEFSLPKRIQCPGFFLAGLSVGLLGIGGGAILTPVIVSTTPSSLVLALGISYTTMPFLTIVSALLHYLYGSPDVFLGISIGFLASIGALLGSSIAKRYGKSLWGKRMIGILMIFVALFVLLE